MTTWTLALTGDGSPTLVHGGHGQACHAEIGAWREALERYVQPCRLEERARSGESVRLLDVGTGPGWNLAAALAAVEGVGGSLEAWTLERDPSVIRVALERFHEGGGEGEFARRHAPLRDALSRALELGAEVAFGERSRLRLLLGDARLTIRTLPEELRFDAVFLDPFSPRVEPELWDPDFLADVARRMAPGGWLSTYSVSQRVTAALFAAGLRVGRGPRVGMKSGTLATPDGEPPPLSNRVRRKIERRAESLRTDTARPS